MSELVELGLEAAARAIGARELSSLEYIEALLTRCQATSELNAFIALDPESVRAAAARADAGRGGGPLRGVALAIKDNIDAVGFATTAGTPALAQNRPDRSACVVQRLVDAGAIVLGKTNLHELAFGITTNNTHFGAARNPYDPARIPGGSSGGSAVAVAARCAPGALGTDTGGSLRVPASLCGIVGFRPTTGRYPADGIVPISHTRDTAGPMARRVADCGLLDAVVTGAPPLREVDLRGLRIGVPRAPFWNDLEAEVALRLESVLQTLRVAGVVLVEKDAPGIFESSSAAGLAIVRYEVRADLGAYLRSHSHSIDVEELVEGIASPDVREIFKRIVDVPIIERAYREALHTRRTVLRELYRAYFRDNDVVAMVFPTTPLPCSLIGADREVTVNGVNVPTFATFIRNTEPGSVAGIPGISIPAATTSAGLPIGLELDAPESADRDLLALARAIEGVLPNQPPPPRPRSAIVTTS